MFAIDNKNNLSCAFAEETVEYLYGETSAVDKNAFERHLKSCPTCAEEFSAFNAVRASVLEWRNEDFATLASPPIEIPYRKTVEFNQTISEAQPPIFWHSRFRRLFSLSPVWTYSAAFALILVGICAAFFFLNISKKDEIADLKENQTIAAPPGASTDSQELASILTDGTENESVNEVYRSNETATAVNNGKIANSVITNKSKVEQRNINRQLTPHKINAIKTANQEISLRRTKESNNFGNKVSPATTNKLPKLSNFEEDEDKSLRLAELLEDADAR